MMPFRESLEKRLHLFDGAMGTYLYQRGVFIDRCYDELNLSRPELVRDIHREYLEAGATVIEANTFGANSVKLERHNLAGRAADINREGVRLAREASAGRAYVAGSMGPLGTAVEPLGSLSLEQASAVFAGQALSLTEAGSDLIVLETFHDLREIAAAVAAVRSVSDLPLIALMTVQEDGRTRTGADVEEIAQRLSDLPVDGIGLNCSIGPKSMLEFLERMLRSSVRPVAVLPNAGRPQSVDGRTFYMSTPDYFGVYCRRFIDAGARILGGCCGTTPLHIRKMAESLAQKQTRAVLREARRETLRAECRPLDPVPKERRSRLADKLSSGGFVRTVEMTPPRGRDLTPHLAGAEKLKAAGIDAVNIPDGPRASARMNGLAMAVKLQAEIGIETVLHIACRDYSLIGLQSFLLGASVLGVRNVLAITGDPPMLGDYPQSSAVFDVDSIGLTRLLNNLNHGLDIGDKPIGSVTEFLIGVGADPSAVNPGRERDRLTLKAGAGAEFVITQPVFDVAPLSAFIEKSGQPGLPFIAGIWPLVSYQNAEFMKNEVPGVVVPDSVLERIGRFRNKEDQLKIGIEIAQEMVRQVRPLVQGVQISAPFGRVDAAISVAEAAR